MSTSTNFLLRSIFSAIFSLVILGAISASSDSFTTIDSCTANIDVQYDSTGGYAILIVSHSGTPNSTIQWSDSSTTEQITVTTSGQYCVTVYTETQCEVTQCVSVDLGAGENCQSYIIKEPLAEGGYMLIAETNDPHSTTSYQWTTGELTNSVIVNQSGEYCVDVMSSYGCPSQACIYVDVPLQNDSCAVTVFSFPDTIYGGAYVGVDPSGIGPFTYLWSNGASSNGIDVDTSGEYCVTVTDAEGCVGIGCKMVEVSVANHIVSFTVPSDIQIDIDVQCYVDTSLALTGDVIDEYTTCGSGFEATYTDLINFICGPSYQITRVWSLADDCGNVEQKTQIILVNDNMAPVFTVPTDVTLFMDPASCAANTSITVTGDVVDEYDNCFSQLDATYTDVVNTIPTDSGCGFNLELLRTWTLTDDCGNAVEKVQIINVVDTTQANQPDSCFFDVVIFEQARTAEVVAIAADPAGVAPFSYIWSDGSTGAVLDVTEVGTYCLTVIDGNGCEGQSCFDVEFESTPQDSCTVGIYIYEIERSNDLVKLGVETTDTTILSSAIWSDGSTEPFLYVQEAGDYCVTAIDEAGCEGYFCYTVEFEPNVDSCFVWIEQIPQSDGSVKLWAHGAGGSDSYTYTWIHDQTIAEPYFYATESGNYCVALYDTNQCQSEACIYIEVQSNSQDTCYSQITKTPDGPNRYKLSVETEGVGPFTIVWHDSLYQNGDYLYVEQSGNYCATVYDANQCESNACIEIVIDTTEPVDSCSTWIEVLPQDDGRVKIWGHTTGTGPFNHTWSTGNTAISDAGEAFTYVTESGEYCITVVDANQCTSQHCVTVTVPDTEPVDSCTVDIYIYEIERSNDLVKLGIETTDSTILSSATWSDGSTEPYLYVQQGGTYCATAIDENGCEGQSCYTVEFETTIDSCAVWIEQIPQADGSVKLWAHGVGGSGSYAYTWLTDQTIAEPYLYATESGNYCVLLYDTNQCQSEACVYVEVVTNTQDSCYSQITKTPDGANRYKLSVETEGVGPFIIVWHDSLYQDGDYLYVEQSGSYCATVYDANQCESNACIDIVIDTTEPVDSCSTWIEILPQDDGRVKIWGHTSGTGPFNHTWSTGNTAISQAGEAFTYVTESGEYCITVVDANQCTSQYCVTVEVPATEPVDSCYSLITKTLVSNNFYKLSVETEGVGPFTIVWHDSLYQDGDYLYVEQSGNYCATVYDANQCESNACIEITIDSNTNDSCSIELASTIYAADFVAEVVAEPTGTAPFSFQWSDGTSGNAIQLFESKDVCVTVTDANGCISTKCIGVDVPQRPCSLQIIRGQNSTDSLVILEAVSEGEGAISYLWRNGSTDNFIYVTESGEYCLTITTANGCTKTECIFIDIENIVCDTEIEYNVNSTDYVAVLDAAPAGVGPFTFEWSNGSTNSSIVVEESGTYCLVVTDSRGCVSEYCKEVILAVPVCESQIEVVAESDDEVTIKVVTEGMAPFEYYWDNGESSQEITVSVSQEYCVEVIDALGCISYDCKYIEVVDYSTCSVEIEVISNADSTEHKVIANPTGTAPFTYEWAHGDTSRYFYPELDGYFCVTVIDAEGCISETCYKTEGITPSVELEAFPNPAQGNFFVEIDSELEFQARVEIRDIKGNLLFTTTVSVEEGVQGLNFNSSEYPSGVFFVNIIRGSHVESIRVIKAGN